MYYNKSDSVVSLITSHRDVGQSPESTALLLPTPGTNQYIEMIMMDEGGKRALLDAGVYEEEDKEATQTHGHTKHYQELDKAKMERREYASIKV